MTPLFCYGINQNRPDIRPPSLKGALRFWWRATRPENNFRQLLKKETRLWGGSNAEEILRSKVRLSITVQDAKINSLHLLRKSVGPHNDGQVNYPGISYLYYSVLYMKQQNSSPNDKHYLAPDTTFIVTFGSASPAILEQALYAFALTSLLGGLGARSRRGAGCLSIESFETKSADKNWRPEWLDKLFLLNDIQDKKQLAERMKEVFQLFGPEEMYRKTPVKPANIHHSHLCGARIYFFDPENSWQKALGCVFKATEAKA
ncbi:MAG: type III-B CRISPR module RAMP protein Cmr1 [Bacillota bacterium]